MSGSRPTVGIRISAEGAEQTRRQLEAVGTAGDAAMRRVAVASAAAAPEMQRLATASDVAQRAFVGMGGSLGRIGATFTGVSGVAAGLTAGFVALGAAASVSAVQIAQAGDTATATLARLASATGGLGQAQQVYERLFALSQQTGVAVAESAGSFARFSVAAREIGGTNDQVLKLVAGIQKAGIVAGSTTQELAAATMQIGQALASGTFQGDELRSMLENMPQLAQALARELGVGIGELRKMGSEGKLTADTVFPALLRASEKISEEFDKMPVTMSRARDILTAATADFGARLDRITGLSETFARFMQQGSAALRSAGQFIAPTEREAAEQAVSAAQRRRDQVAAQVAAERAASAYGDVAPGLAEAERIAEAELREALSRRSAILRDDREMQRAADQAAADQAREAARTSATIRLRDLSADLDASFKARQAYADKIKKIDQDEARGGTLPAGVTFDGLRAAAARELEEALEKAARSTERVADGHRAIAREAADADSHVKAYLKEQEKAADAVAKAQQKAAQEIERFHTRSFDAVANIGERAFDRVGDALVQAFVSGEGAAVNFGGVLRGVIASAVADIAKLAVVNPILNSVFTSSSGARPTLAGAFGGGGLGSGGFGGLGGMLSSGYSLLSSGGYLAGGGGLSGALFGSPGMVGASYAESIAPTAGLFGSGGSFSFGSLGSTLGGIGGGFGLGSTLGGLVANSQAQQQNAQIGAALGSLLGSLGGPLGSLIGGTLGGGLGGLIGPGESVQAYGFRLQSSGRGPDNTDVNEMGDRLLPIDRRFYNDSGAAAFQQADALVAGVNAYLAANGLQVGGVSIIEGNKDGAANLSQGFAQLRFGSAEDTRLNSFLTGQTFDDPAKLQAAVEGFKQAAAAIDALGAEAVPAFTASLKAINDNFDAGEEQARKYGLAEDNLTSARAKAIAALESQRAETLRQTDVSLSIRRLAAAGSSMEAELARQAEAARQEVTSFTAALDALALAAEDKSARLVQLEEVQAAERAAIIQRFGEQAAAALRQAGSGIRQYLDGLATGTAAGASPTDRLTAAQAAFDRDRTLSMGGDRDALGRVTGSADALLSAGRDMFASGPAFQALVASVRTGLSNLPVVQSYDAMQAASLEAIQASIQNGTLNTAIVASGNTVTVANLGALADLAAGLAAMQQSFAALNTSIVTGLAVVAGNVAGLNASTVAGLSAVNAGQGTANAATVAGLAGVAGGIDGLAAATVGGLGVLADSLAAINASTVAGHAANGQALAILNASTVAGLAVVGQGVAVVNAGIVAGLAALNSGQAVTNAILAGGFDRSVAAIVANRPTTANDNASPLLRDINTSLGTVDRSLRDVNTSLATVDGRIGVGLAAVNASTVAGLAVVAQGLAVGNTIAATNLAGILAATQAGASYDLITAGQIQSVANSALSAVLHIATHQAYTLQGNARLVDINTSLGTVDRSVRDLNTSLATVDGRLAVGLGAVNASTVAGLAVVAQGLAVVNASAVAGLAVVAQNVAGGTATTATTISAGTSLQSAYHAASLGQRQALYTELQQLRQEVAQLRAVMQQAAVAQASETRAGALLVATRVEEGTDQLRRIAA
jgi:tape measure domain-containing protein